MGTIYRDDDYGVLGISLAETGLEVVDYGCRDKGAVVRVLEAQAELVSQDGPVSTWRPTVHQRIVEANIDRTMRSLGYGDDPLGAKAVLQVENVRDHDIPMQGHVHVSEAVERVMGSHLGAAASKLGVPITSATFEAYPRPNAVPCADGRKPPFFVARAMASGLSEADAAQLQATWRNALAPLGPGLVRATAQRADEGVVVFEAGYLLPTKAMEAFESAELPAFEQATILGAREIHIHLGERLADADLERIRERAEACTAATGIIVVEGEPRVLRARVPSTHEGDHLGDDTFRERVTWLTRELAEWGPSLEWVGRMRTAMDEGRQAAAIADFVGAHYPYATVMDEDEEEMVIDAGDARQASDMADTLERHFRGVRARVDRDNREVVVVTEAALPRVGTIVWVAHPDEVAQAKVVAHGDGGYNLGRKMRDPVVLKFIRGQDAGYEGPWPAAELFLSELAAAAKSAEMARAVGESYGDNPRGQWGAKERAALKVVAGVIDRAFPGAFEMVRRRADEVLALKQSAWREYGMDPAMVDKGPYSTQDARPAYTYRDFTNAHYRLANDIAAALKAAGWTQTARDKYHYAFEQRQAPSARQADMYGRHAVGALWELALMFHDAPRVGAPWDRMHLVLSAFPFDPAED